MKFSVVKVDPVEQASPTAEEAADKVPAQQVPHREELSSEEDAWRNQADGFV